MTRFGSRILTTIAVILIAVAIIGIGSTPPIWPSSFYGTVMVNGAYVADGTAISAWIGGTQYAATATFTFEGQSVYILDVPADNPSTGEKDGGEEGDVIAFLIGSDAADPSGTWHAGTNVELNLAASTTPPAPNAGFSGSPTSGIAPLMVDFTDSSSGSISTWSWDFGDSGSSSLANPSHEFTSPGTYTVALTVTGPGGSDTETKVDYITVSAPPPIADFSASPTSGAAPLTVDFTSQSTGGITSWDWDFGDGGSSSSANPSHEYTVPGNYSVSLTVSGPGGTDTKTEENFITVYEEIMANFSASPIAGAAPMDVSFTDLSVGDISSWSWTFGDGGSSTLANPSHQYSTPGDYTVSLAVSGPAGSDSETKVNYIKVAEQGSLVADFSGTPASGDVPLEVSFTDLSSGDVTSWLWTFGDGGSSTDPNPSHEYLVPGTYTVTLQVSDSEETDIEQKLDYITVSEPAPEIFTVFLPAVFNQY